MKNINFMKEEIIKRYKNRGNDRILWYLRWGIYRITMIMIVLLFLFCLRFKESPLDPTSVEGIWFYYFLNNGDKEALGILDRSFGNNGKVITDVTGNLDSLLSLQLQSDGKIVTGGNCNNDVCLVRYNVDGSLDTTFGSAGIVIISPSTGADSINSLQLQSDGKIVGGGSCSLSSIDFCLARYNVDGSLDNTFNSGYMTATDITGNTDVIHALQLQSDGKIVAGGECFSGTDNDSCLVRYNSNGSLDNTFGSGGKQVIQVSGTNNDMIYDLKIQNDGKIVSGGKCYSTGSSSDDFCLARYNSNGSLDNTFNGGIGKVWTDFAGGLDSIHALQLQSDGKMIAGGSCWNGSNDDFCLARYNSNGSLGNTFGGGTGKVITDITGDSDVIYALQIQNNGKIIVGGKCYNGLDFDFCLARYNSDGSLDTGFGNGGFVITDVAGGNDTIYTLQIQDDGKIVVGGECFIGSNRDFCLARYQ